MYFDDTNKQWISTGPDVMKFGMKLKDEIIRYGKDVIPAGTVMVFARTGKPYLMFQLLQDLVLSSARDTTLLYYERGSIVFLGGDEGFVSTLRFRDCRMPTENEFRIYETMATI